MANVVELTRAEANSLGPDRTAEALETGGLILFPELGFEVSDAEARLLDPAVLNGKSKNVSFDPASGELGGTSLEGRSLEMLAGMVRRYSTWAEALLGELVPSYAPALQKRRTSYRPGAVATRALSPRKDDRRLHVDAFPANPVQGRRILRVFTNIDPARAPRVWNVGEESFAAFAARFERKIRPRAPGAKLLQALGVTKGRRSAYDQAMLDLHDAAKLDESYQRTAPKRRLEFPAGATWIVYTDSTLHAALAGQHCLEQTFLLPVEGMRDEAQSPLRILERMTRSRLV